MSLPSAEVAADFRDALNDLKFNSRPEISNLTIIAKENTEHAQAISRELEEHIKTTRPEYKLPALYVLDSIVKNVGTPYTVYLGRNLYNTFVNTYTLVDNPTRKALEGLLRTWKQPVPESMDTRPVFPVDITRAIDNMLLKYKTVIAQQQQNQPRAAGPFPGPDPRATHSPFPPGSAARQSPAQNGMPFHPPPMPARQSPAPAITLPFGMPPQAYRNSPVQSGTPFAPPAAPSLEKIQGDVERLIVAAKLDFAANPYDPEKQKRLKTFLDLQTILKAQQLPPDQLRAVEQQLATLGGASLAPSAPVSIAPVSTPLASLGFPMPTPTPQIPSIPTPSQQSSTPAPPVPPGAQPPSLADLLRGFNSATPSQNPTPAPPPASAPPAAAPVNNTFSLLDTLRAQGLLGGGSTPMPAFATPAPSANTGSTRNDVELTKDSIKRPRPELIGLLYEARPNQCSTCGRRFPSGDEGKVQKRRHLDWHFKVKDPNLVKQAIHRSWYIGEKEWIEYREQDEAKPPPETNGNAAAAAKTNQQRWVRIPLDPELVNAPCPICQEKFTPSRLDDEFVWMDTIQVGPKYFHASCYEEAYGNARSTPVSILGKRPADEGANTPSKKMLV
ncbi:mRNA 3' end processing factor [Diplodia intermedia]|uniref:mRNA 3' end processing factor n=1 Tax=Diplodia intermedia TaxID=856260 RepID=A0ABR3TT73_9PEZI